MFLAIIRIIYIMQRISEYFPACHEHYLFDGSNNQSGKTPKLDLIR